MSLCCIPLSVFDLVLSAVIQSAAVTQDIGVISVNVGDNVTLHCFHNSQVAMHFSWYRQTLGGRPELLSSLYKHDKKSKVFTWMEKNLRFSVKKEEGMNNLDIADAQFSDSATYFCGSSHSNIVEFGVGVFLSVKGIVPFVVLAFTLHESRISWICAVFVQITWKKVQLNYIFRGNISSPWIRLWF